MDGQSLPQSNKDLTDRSRRRVSSILKAPRSPLKDLGCGNELYQDLTLDKRRKSSRRVSFAETISVFAPELQCAGEAAANSNDHEEGGNNPKNEIQESANTDYNIAGMETLLHAPIQTTVLQSEWERGDCPKDRTVFFSSNNDMDITTSNTVTIDGYPELKTPKIDIGLFLANLKSQTEALSENTEFQFSKSAQTKLGFQSTEALVPAKRKFDDFLSSLKMDPHVAPLSDEGDKENVFPSSLPSGSSRHLFSGYGNTIPTTQETTGNVTKIFREYNDGLDLTKCHTTHITSFIPLGNNEYGSNGLANKPSKDQSRVFEDDMDMTYSHTVHIDAVHETPIISNIQSFTKKQYNANNIVPSEKTIVFTEANEMEFTKNHTFALNTMLPQTREASLLELTPVSPVEDMDFTKSHTVAINGQSIFNQYATMECEKMSQNQDINIIQSVTPDLYSESNLMNKEGKCVLGEPFGHPNAGFDEQFMQAKSFVLKTESKDAIGSAEPYNVSIICKNPQDSNIPHALKAGKTDKSKYGGLQLSSLSNKSTLFLADNDLPPTKCLPPELPSKENQFNPKSNPLSKIHKKRESVNVLSFSCVHDKTEHLQEDMEMTINGIPTPCSKDKTILFSRDQQDMDITQSHTVVIDSKGFIDGRQVHENNTFSGFRRKSGTSLVAANYEGGLSNFDVRTDLCDDETVFAPENEDEMEFTKSYTVSIENKMDKESGNGIPLTKRQSMSEKESSPLSLCVESQGKAMLCPSNKNINIVKQSTTDERFRCLDYENNKIIEQVSQVATMESDKTLVLAVEMELTESHNIINTKDSTETFSQHGPVGKSFVCAPDIQDGMDITNSHTVYIDNVLMDERPVVAGQPFSVKRKSTTDLLRTCANDKTAHALSDFMELTSADAGRLFEAPMHSERETNPVSRPSRDKSLLFLNDSNAMDITRSYTVAIENKLFERNGNPNPVMKADQTKCSETVSASANKTILKDDMEFTKSHTVFINGNNQLPLCESSTLSVRDEMEITKSNTVFIDNIPSDMPKVDLRSLNVVKRPLTSSQVSCVSHDRTVHSVDDMEMTMPANTGLTGKRQLKTEDERTIYKSVKSQDKTLVFNSEESHMDITRSHSVSAENQLVDDVYNICSLERKCQLNRSNLHLACNMDITKSNTVFIDNLFADEIPHRTCAPDNKIVNSHSTAGHFISKIQNQPAGISEGSSDKTLVFSDDMNDMDITRSQTIVIENKVFEVNKAHSANVKNTLINDTEALSVKETINPIEDEIELDKSRTLLIDKNTSQAPKDTFPASRGVAGLLCDQEDVEMTKTNAVFINNTLTDGESKAGLLSLPFVKRKSISYSQILSTTSNGHPSLEVQMVPSMLICGRQAQASETASSRSSPGKMASSGTENIITKTHADVENGEFGEVATRNNARLKDTNEREITSAEVKMKDGHENTDDDVSSNIVREINSAVTQDQSLSATSLMKPALSIDRTDLFTNNALLKKATIPDANATRSLLETEISRDIAGNCLKTGDRLVNNRIEYQDRGQKDCVPFDIQNDCITLTEDKSSVQDKDTCSYRDDQSDKKARPKSKRVSFMLPEKADLCVHTTEVIDETNTVRNPFSHISPRSETPVHSMVGRITDRSPNGPTVQQKNIVPGDCCSLPDCEFGLSHSVTDVSVTESVYPCAGISELSKNDNGRRRSIADIHLKIKSLAQKSEKVPSHTAPVSCFVDQLPTPEEKSGDRLSTNEEYVLDTERTPSKEPSMEKRDELFKEDSISPARANSKEMCLPNMLSVKIFQPKLPQKRSSSIHNVPELHPSVSEAHVNRKSQSIFKALPDDAQNIDEEMLPVCPEDPDPNGLLHLEVPEGAWEELCEKEALHIDLGQPSFKPQETKTAQKRARDTEDDEAFRKEKRARQNEDADSQGTAMSMACKSPDEYYTSEYSALHATKTLEATNFSGNSSSMDSRGEGVSVEGSSQHCSQMDSQLPWEPECLWQKFQEGTITVKEFFTLLRIRILIQKPRSSVIPANLGGNEQQSDVVAMLDQHLYQPKLQVYEEHFNTLYQTAEELKICIEMQEKPLAEVNSLLWEAIRMCSEDEIMYFGMKLKSLKALYTKRNKLIAHQGKVTVYSKLLQSLQDQWEQLQSRMSEADKLLQEVENCISGLDMETDRLKAECLDGNTPYKDQGVQVLQNEIEDLKLQEESSSKKGAQLEERKQQVLGELGRLQEEAQTLNKYLQENNFTEWTLDSWTDDQAILYFLYDSLELTVQFGDFIDGVNCINTPCRQISSIRFESLLNDTAPSSSLLVHRLILHSIERKGHLHESYKTQQDLPQLLFDVSLIVNRCRLLGEEVQYLIKWGAKFNLLKTEVDNSKVKLVFSSVAACAKFELIVHLSELYPMVPLSFTVQNLIGKIDHDKISAIFSKVPVGFEYLKRAICQIYTSLLI
ncbi:kinetochore scaffold 1 [Spea bombifrons]|uniref:kinetochore scaffold 1 n=1 Tax=Spea bombifrons TaxID=233779 RepID=UPI00234BD5F8|nr:kinetochore scaffold 1 [Spea bombifrons]